MKPSLRTHRRVFHDLGLPSVVMATDGAWWMNDAARELFYSPEWRRRPHLEIPLRVRSESAPPRSITVRSLLDDAHRGSTVTDVEFEVQPSFHGLDLTLAVSTHRLLGRRSQVVGFLALFRDHSAQARRERELAAAAELDPLTGVANRRGLDGCVARIRTRARTQMSAVALMILDIDHFKQCNDRFGHAAGDLVLTRVSERIASVMGEHGVVARLGGDEFVAVCVVDNGYDALVIAETLLARVRTPVVHHTGTVDVTVSIGLTVMAGDDEAATTSALLGSADQALYEAKRLGRDRVVLTRSLI